MEFLFVFLLLGLSVWLVYIGIKAIKTRETFLYTRGLGNQGKLVLYGDSAIFIGVVEIILAIIVLVVFLTFLMSP